MRSTATKIERRESVEVGAKEPGALPIVVKSGPKSDADAGKGPNNWRIGVRLCCS